MNSEVLQNIIASHRLILVPCTVFSCKFPEGKEHASASLVAAHCAHESDSTDSGDLTPSANGLPERGWLAGSWLHGEAPGPLQGGTTRNRLPSLGGETKGTNPTERLLNANFGLGTLF